MSIFSIIDNVRKRPGMYLGCNNITALKHFLDGYMAAERDYDLCDKTKLFPLSFRYMHEFVKERLNGDTNLGWCHQILNFCNGDEERALNTFFELYDEFIQITMTKYWKALLTEDNIQWNNSMKRAYTIRDERKKPIFDSPVAVYVVQLSIQRCILLVETTNEIHQEHQFFESFEQASGNGTIPAGAEVYFGVINSWQEYVGENIVFKKQ